MSNKESTGSLFASLIAKYPNKKELIIKRQNEANISSCSPCQAKRIYQDLYIELNADNWEVEAKDAFTSSKVLANHTMSPRPPCEDCFKEHIAKAIININESLIGDAYPKHRWLAIGNLAEASAEILGLNKELAKEIRVVKLEMIKNKSYIPDLMKYL